MGIILSFFLFPFIAAVVILWPLAVAFGRKGKKKIRNVLFAVIGMGAAVFIGMYVSVYLDLAYEKIQTQEGEVWVRSESVKEFETGILCDSVVKVKKCLQEEPALEDHCFDSSINGYGKAVESDSLQVVAYLLENGQEVDRLTPFVYEEEQEIMRESAVNFYCRQKNPMSDLSGTGEWKMSAKDSFKPEMIRLLLGAGSDLSRSDEYEKPLLQDYLACCCADSDFSEEEFQLFEELEAAGMDLDAEFWDDGLQVQDENGDIDAAIYFQKLAELTGIDEDQKQMYDRVILKLQK